MRLVVGLGNPGINFLNNRHNIGFRVLDVLADRHLIKFKKMLFIPAYYGKNDSSEYLLVKPTTFMNHSGKAVWKIIKQKKIKFENLVVVYDDLDLVLGTIRVRSKGSAGTHNGMRSIIDWLKIEEFTRVRIGIGPLPKNKEVKEFVLGDFSVNEDLEAEKVVEQAADAIESLSSVGIEKTMNMYNKNLRDN